MNRILVFLALLIVSLSGLFYVKDRSTAEYGRYPEYIDRTERLQELQRRLAIDILSIENGSIRHYDRLTDDMHALETGIEVLLHGENGIWHRLTNPEIDKVLASAHQNILLEGELVEDFKTHYAIFSNSVRFIATLSSDGDVSEMRYFRDRPDMQAAILDHIKDVFGFLQTGDAKIKADLEGDIRRARRHDAGLLSAVEHRVWLNILRHIEIILAEKAKVERILDRVVTITDSTDLDELGRLLQKERARDLARLDLLSQFLTVVALVLFIAMLHGLVRNHRRTRELRQTVRELENQKFALDQHAIVSITDTNGNIKYVNDKFIERTGYSREELIGQNHRMLKSDEHPREFFQDMWHTILGGEVWHGDVCDLDKQGRRIWVSSTIVPFLDEDGKPYQFVAIRSDLTHNKETERELFEAKERAQVILASVGDAVISIDREQRIDYVNPVAEGLAGLEATEIVGRRFDEFFEIIDELERTPDHEVIDGCLATGHTATLSSNMLINRIDGREFAVEIIIAPTHDPNGNITGAVLAMHDMTEVRGLTKKIAHQANTDPLTGLSNRNEFERILRKLLRKSQKDGCEHVLCYIDLDHFKIVNDTCGHVAGDELLRQVAGILRGQIRDRDLLARIGGDEFALLLGECPMSRATEIVSNICREIKAFRFSWEGKIFQIGASIGLAPIDPQTPDTVTVMRHADTACYMAKDRGRNGYYVYHEADEEISQRAGEMDWISRLTQALDEERFVLYCHQARPLHDDIPYREVLLRMRSDDDQIVSPMAFIPAAERHGLMADIDRWVIHAVLSRYRECPVGEIVAINLSGASLSDKGLADFIVGQIREHEIDSRRLCFEITETAAIANLVSAMALIERLKSEGCLFALDDFGSGLSSFGYLKQLPVDFLKIDGVFVRDMLDNHFDRAMVESINHIGHVMGLKTIAEFVESERLLNQLVAMGVDYAQGYAISRPTSFLADPENGEGHGDRIVLP